METICLIDSIILEFYFACLLRLLNRNGFVYTINSFCILVVFVRGSSRQMGAIQFNTCQFKCAVVERITKLEISLLAIFIELSRLSVWFV